jgi:hypothetical protein
VDTNHLTPQRIAAFVARQLAGNELLAVDDHLAACPECRARLRAAWPVADAVAAWQRTIEPPRWHTAAAVCSLLGLAAVLLLVLLGPPAVPVGPGPRQAAESPAGGSPAAGEESPPERIVTALRDGALSLELSNRGTVSGLEPLPPPWRERIAAALRRGRLPLDPLVAELAGTAAALRGADEEGGFALLAPLGTAVAEATPLFRWSDVPGAAHYRVRVSTTDYRLVAESPPLVASRWRPEASLPSGETLTWQVTASVDGEEITAPQPPAPEARFVVLAPGEAEALSTALRDVGGSRLGRAVAYAAAGCRQDAARELAALAADNPSSTLVRSLLDSVAGR